MCDETFRFGCTVTAWQTSAGNVLELLCWLCHLPGLRVATMLVMKKDGWFSFLLFSPCLVVMERRGGLLLSGPWHARGPWAQLHCWLQH